MYNHSFKFPNLNFILFYRIPTTPQPLLCIDSPLNIPNQPPLLWFPIQPTPRLLTRAGIIQLQTGPQKSKPALRLLCRNTHSWYTHGLPNRLRDALGGHTLLRDSMRSRPRRSFLDRQLKDLGSVETVGGRPHIAAFANIGRFALFRGDLDKLGDEAVAIAIAVVGGREANHTRLDALLRKGQRGRFGSAPHRS